ncbi:MAG: thiosulfate oxidation carrier complex protein SoxZ [Candidatus Thiodiazotropha endolucinida]
MANDTRIRTRRKGDHTEILVLIKHPIEPEQQPDMTSKGHFIQRMDFFLNGSTVAVAELGPNIEESPLIGISVKNANKGDRVSARWVDTAGVHGEAETDVR